MKRLHSLSYKTLLTIFFFAVAGIVFILKFGFGNQAVQVSAAWWDDMWHYRKAISIDNSSGSDLTDFQVALSIGTSQLIADGKMQNNCNDIRVTDINGNLLPIYVQSNNCNTNSTIVWIKTTLIPASGSTVYVYYGNNSAESISSNSWLPTGGTLTETDAGLVQSFTGNDTFISQTNFNADVLVVAGGGAGGSHKTYPSTGTGAGGGGAGGLIFQQNYTINSNYNFNIEIGIGGTSPQTYGTGGNGTNSTFNDLTAIGGGGGGGRAFNPNNGGSGGGVGYNSNVGGVGTSGQGYDGGSSNSAVLAGAGGGGASQTGVFATNSSGTNGGNGLCLSEFFTNQFGDNGCFSGGGGGGAVDGNSIGIGGTGGGGNGGVNSDGISAIANTGGGGGGSGDSTWIGGNGGSGIVLISYPTKSVSNPISQSIQSEESGGGPIAYWKFDEGSGTTAYDSAGSNNGTLGTGSSAPTWANESQCISGKCLSFSGTGDNVSLDFIPNFREAFTVSIWMKRTTDFNQTTDVMFLSPQNAWYFYDAYNSGSVRGDVYIDGTRRAGISVPVPFDGNWYYITYTYDSNTHQSKMYKNGKLYQTVTLNGLENYLVDQATGSLYDLGKNTKNRGMILDEPKIYPYARTADQIKQDYNSRGSLSGSGVNLGIQSSTAPSLKSSLIAHYKFDENNGTTVYDSSGNDNNGTFGTGNSAPVWTNESQCVFGKCLNFDGSNDYIQIPHNQNLNPDNGVTVTAWVKWNTNNKQWEWLVAKNSDSGASSGYMLAKHSTSDTIGFIINGKLATIPRTFFSTGQWYHLVGTATPNGSANLYVNGKLEKTVSGVPSTISYYSGALGINKSFYYASPPIFNGSIDEVKVYNRALTPDEVKQDYNSGSAIQFGSATQNIGGTTTSLDYCIPGDTSACSTPVAEWKMDEGIGTSIVDTSGNNNTGTISGATFTQGKIGSALSFDGTNDYTYATNNTSITSTQTTISAWVKLNSLTNYPRIIDIRDGTNGIQILYDSPSGKFVTKHSQFQSDAYGTQWNSPTIGIWYHIAAVFNSVSNTTEFYVNGIQQVGSTNTNVNNGSGTNVTYIGARSGLTSTTFLSGIIDNVKIYNYARTPAQIAYDYNKGGPVGWWKFDECQGSTAYDWSGNQNNGTIIIGASGSQNSLGTCAVGTSAAWTNGSIGKINSSLNFDGTNDYVSVANNNLFNFGNNNFTISLWAKKTTNSYQTYGPLISKGLYSNAGEWNLYEYTNNNHWNFYADGSKRFEFNADIGQKWGNIIIGRKSDQMFVYFNGQETNSTSDSISGNNINFTNTKNFTIGTRDNGSTYFFNGQIDDVRIYNYALTLEQVKQVYNGGSVNFN